MEVVLPDAMLCLGTVNVRLRLPINYLVSTIFSGLGSGDCLGEWALRIPEGVQSGTTRKHVQKPSRSSAETTEWTLRQDL